jgi:DnaJ-class molecular chaperone
MVEELCPICSGTGQVPNIDLTACYKTCPACNGNGTKSKRVDIYY